MRPLLVLLVLLALTGCDAGAAAPDGPSPELVALAEPLVDAHDALLEHAEVAEDDLAGAAATWPQTRARVGDALEAVPAPEGTDLPARERSTLVGYQRGLEVATAAWGAVHEPGADAEARMDDAHARMRHLDRLRAGVTP